MSGITTCLTTQNSFTSASSRQGKWLLIFLLGLLFSFPSEVVGQNGVTISSQESPGPTNANPIPLIINFEEGVNDLVPSDFTVENGELRDIVRKNPSYKHFETNDLAKFRVNPGIFEILQNSSRLNEFFKEKLARAVIAIDVDRNDNIFYLTFADGVFKYNPSGTDQRVISKNYFDSPFDLVISSTNQIIVADKDAYRVRVFNEMGTHVYDIGGVMGKDGNEFYGPTGLAIDKDDHLYVADAYTGNAEEVPDQIKIYKLSPTSHNFLQRYASSNGVVINNPYRIAVDLQGNVFVADSGGNTESGRVLIFNNQNVWIKTIEGGEQGAPGDLIVDDYGYLYIIDYEEDLTFNGIFDNPVDLAYSFNSVKDKNYYINVFNRNFTFETKFNQNINLPIDLALNSCGNILINDMDLSGTITLSSLKVDATFDFKIKKYKRQDNFTANLIPTVPSLVTVILENKNLFKCNPQPQGEFSITYQSENLTSPPVANNDNYTTNQDVTLNVTAANGVLKNDTDQENDPLTANLISTTTNGTLTFNSNGSFTYVPNAGYSGPDNFTYVANDGKDNSNTATVTIEVVRVEKEFDCKTEVVLELDESGNAVLNPQDLYTGDAQERTFNISKTNFTCNDLGENYITLTHDNGTCEVKVDVQDNHAPVVQTRNVTVFLGEEGRVNVSPALIGGGTSDNCGEVTLSLDRTSFSCKDLGENQVQLTAVDGNGNSVFASAIVTVTGTCDEEPPPAGGNGLDDIYIYPNPTPGPFTIATPSGTKIRRVEIYDFRGRFILSKDFAADATSYTLDITGVEQAIYVLKLETSDGRRIRRVIKY